ncbi:hypothetical protein P8X24_06020 [Pyrococcus kukulkanii]
MKRAGGITPRCRKIGAKRSKKLVINAIKTLGERRDIKRMRASE